MITAPVRLTGSVHPQQLASIVSIDAYLRRQTQLGLSPLPFVLGTIAGDVATQAAVRKLVVREGDDREELGREGFAARAKRLTVEAQSDLKSLLGALNVEVDLDTYSAGSVETVRAARIAFVRLYEAGLLQRRTGVVDSCPSCETVVDAADVDEDLMDAVHLRLRLATTKGDLEIQVAEPELLVGTVAVAVPPGHELAGAEAFIPLLDAQVAVIPVEGTSTPTMVVPGHFQWAFEVAQQMGSQVVQVLDGEGVVRHPGPLEGLSRYAARAAATEALAVDGIVVARFEEPVSTRRCHRCGTVLVSLLGRHWILDMAALARAVEPKLTAEELRFIPLAASKRMLELLAQSEGWSVSQQLWSGEVIPSMTCLDCSQVTVSVDAPDSCPTCMGTLSQDPEVLDARFIAAMGPLVVNGWPGGFDSEQAHFTSLAVGRYGLEVWAAPMAALSLRLAGNIAFGTVLVNKFAIGAPEIGQQRITDETARVREVGARVARAALISGDFDTERAAESVRLVDSPAVGHTSIVEVVTGYDAALSALDPGEAFLVLVNAARNGVDPEDTFQFSQLVQALLGSKEG